MAGQTAGRSIADPRGDHFPPGMPDRWENFRAIRRDAFLAVGGFDDIGYGEDMTLASKLGLLADAVPGARMRHRHPDSLAEIWENRAGSDAATGFASCRMSFAVTAFLGRCDAVSTVLRLSAGPAICSSQSYTTSAF